MENAKIIDSFSGQYRFLSNFWPCEITSDNLTFKSVEAAYQAAKSDNAVYKFYLSTMSPGDAKRFGRQIELKPDWNFTKVQVMKDLLFQKFTKHSDLGEMLLATGSAELIEGNSWGDTFWGVCKGVGDNNLGRLLMRIRETLPRFLRESKVIGSSFKVEYCTLCETFFVRCPKCGNNCCNGGSGLDGKCDICSLSYKIQDCIDNFIYPERQYEKDNE